MDDPLDPLPPDPDPAVEAPAPGKADTPYVPPAHAAGIACERPNARSCDGDAPLRCVAGSGGAKWMADEPCDAAIPCVPDFGCMPLPDCEDDAVQSCVGQELFLCDALEDGSRQWHHIETCPEGVPCIDGRGCPNPFGIGTECSFVQPPRCADGQVMECELQGIDARWGLPVDCPPGHICEPGTGCQLEAEEDPDDPEKSGPTSPPDPDPWP